MAEKHLTPEEMSFLADEKILHGFGKVPSTEGKSSLDAVNFGTLATNTACDRETRPCTKTRALSALSRAP